MGSERRFLVGRAGGNKDVLACPAAEEFHVGFHVFGSEGEELDDGVEGQAIDGGLDRAFVPDVGLEQLYARFLLFRPASPVEMEDFIAFSHGIVGAGG